VCAYKRRLQRPCALQNFTKSLYNSFGILEGSLLLQSLQKRLDGSVRQRGTPPIVPGGTFSASDAYKPLSIISKLPGWASHPSVVTPNVHTSLPQAPIGIGCIATRTSLMKARFTEAKGLAVSDLMYISVARTPEQHLTTTSALWRSICCRGCGWRRKVWAAQFAVARDG
jgi:hypothetical protein